MDSPLGNPPHNFDRMSSALCVDWRFANAKSALRIVKLYEAAR